MCEARRPFVSPRKSTTSHLKSLRDGSVADRRSHKPHTGVRFPFPLSSARMPEWLNGSVRKTGAQWFESTSALCGGVGVEGTRSRANGRATPRSFDSHPSANGTARQKSNSSRLGAVAARLAWNQEQAGSIPAGAILGASSRGSRHRPVTAEITGSNPVALVPHAAPRIRTPHAAPKVRRGRGVQIRSAARGTSGKARAS